MDKNPATARNGSALSLPSTIRPSRFLRLARLLAAVALLIFVALVRASVALADDCAGFLHLCDHHNGSPETLTYQIVFVVYWGPQWGDGTNGSGFTGNPAGVSEPQYVNYLESFLETIGGTAYLDTQTQYGAGNPSNIF